MYPYQSEKKTSVNLVVIVFRVKKQRQETQTSHGRGEQKKNL